MRRGHEQAQRVKMGAKGMGKHEGHNWVWRLHSHVFSCHMAHTHAGSCRFVPTCNLVTTDTHLCSLAPACTLASSPALAPICAWATWWNFHYLIFIQLSTSLKWTLSPYYDMRNCYTSDCKCKYYKCCKNLKVDYPLLCSTIYRKSTQRRRLSYPAEFGCY